MDERRPSADRAWRIGPGRILSIFRPTNPRGNRDVGGHCGVRGAPRIPSDRRRPFRTCVFGFGFRRSCRVFLGDRAFFRTVSNRRGPGFDTMICRFEFSVRARPIGRVRSGLGTRRFTRMGKRSRVLNLRQSEFARVFFGSRPSGSVFRL